MTPRMLATDIQVTCRCGATSVVPFDRLGARVPCARCGGEVEVTMRLDELLPPPELALARVDNRVRPPSGVALVPVTPTPAPAASARRSARRRSSGARARARAERRVSDQLIGLLWVFAALLAVIVIAAAR